MDRNSTIGFVLIGLLLIAMFYMNSKNRLAYEAEQKRIEDSIIKSRPKPAVTPTAATGSSLDSAAGVVSDSLAIVPESITYVENQRMRIGFTNRGARPVSVELKSFRKFDGTPVFVQQSDYNALSYRFNDGLNRSAESKDVMFSPASIIRNADGSQQVGFTYRTSAGATLNHLYTIPANDYMVQCSLSLGEVDRLFVNRDMTLYWQTASPKIEKDSKYELTQTHFCYKAEDDTDFEYMGGDKSLSLNKTRWMAVKQQFFLTALVSDVTPAQTLTEWKTFAEDTVSDQLTQVITKISYSLPSGKDVVMPYRWYFGPSDYTILKQYGMGLETVVPYGNGIFAFVKYINRGMLLPVFDFFRRHIASMGIVILLLTLFIRLITSPILYKSYLSGAKMKALKPEVDALREKYKDDQQAFGMEQMKLWRTAGVNPLGGCIPALLQIPIFMSLYYFFQSNIDLRGKAFLWAKDLAQYDSVLELPFSIPFYGDHVSLFTITAVLTSLAISLYGISNMQDNSNPMMKYMPYIFPVLLLGVFNSLPAALTWYYTISNTITLILQFVIQKYIIDHDKIMLEIAENRKKPVKKSKLQERIEAMQESQRKLQEMKNKNRG